MSFEITDFTTDQPSFRKVNYFGIILQVPIEKYYIATDENGDIYAYSSKPWLGDTYWRGGSFGADVKYLGDVAFEGDWKESLMEIENV
jgi:hypothetical protein